MAAVGAILAWPAAGQEFFIPSAVFVQGGMAHRTQQVTLGLIWNWGRAWALGEGQVTGYWEVSASHWSYPAADGRGTSGLEQLDLIPVLRYRPADGTSPWFTEAGIGATVTSAVYETGGTRFSTRFNFGDHLALGRSFGPGRAHEVALRIQHFSNGNIRQPNPGANFIQLRYRYPFG